MDIVYSANPVKFSVLAFQEIWSVPKSFSIPGYGKLEYSTRDKNGPLNPNCGGGVGFFIDERYKDYEVLEQESVFIPHVYESIWVKIKTKDGPDKIIGNIYRPNTAPLANLERSIEIHNQIIDNILANKNHKKCDIQIVADFNINMLNFQSHGLTNDYINSLISKSFLPIITLPTRIKHHSATLIDHIWTNKVCNFYNSGIIINSVSDHFPVFYFDESKNKKMELPEQITRQINSKTVPAFCKLLKSTSWSNVLNEPTPNLAFENFFEKFNSARDISFPEVKVKQKTVHFKHNPWMSRGLKVSQKRKEKLFAKKTKFPSAQNIERFKTYNKMYCKIRRAAKKIYYNTQFTKFSKDSKQTWSLIKDIVGSKRSKEEIPSYFKQNGYVISDYMEIADWLDTFFSNIGPKLASDIGRIDKSF